MPFLSISPFSNNSANRPFLSNIVFRILQTDLSNILQTPLVLIGHSLPSDLIQLLEQMSRKTNRPTVSIWMDKCNIKCGRSFFLVALKNFWCLNKLTNKTNRCKVCKSWSFEHFSCFFHYSWFIELETWIPISEMLPTLSSFRIPFTNTTLISNPHCSWPF
jgi:hypothetical protein